MADERPKEPGATPVGEAKANAAARSPFPARFARRAPTAQAGPRPGELLDFKKPVGKAVIKLADFFPAQSIQEIEAHGALSFHAMGDSGVGTAEQHMVADAMSRDIDVTRPEAGPAFLLHLGDILYGPDKLATYAGRFYRPNDNYHNLIFGIPGNHDGEVHSKQDHFSLEAYLENFCQPPGHQPAMGVQFGRAMPNQPGAYWRLNCPFVDIVGLYSGTGENYGAIARAEIGNDQKVWLAATLRDIAVERQGGSRQALIIAVHHPPYASGLGDSDFGHPGNPDMLRDIDDCCAEAGVLPDAVLSAHAHNYQRYMRTAPLAGQQRVIPYLVAGGGGIGTQAAPAPIGTIVGDVHYENGVEAHGFLTVTASPARLTLIFTRTETTHRDIFETVSIDLASGQRV